MADDLRRLPTRRTEAVFYTSRPHQQRGRVPLPALRPPARHEQPAGLLQHVPRVQRGRRSSETLGVGKGIGDARGRARGRPDPRRRARTRAPTTRACCSALEEAKRRGGKIIAVNPLPEAGMKNFRNPQTPRGVSGVGSDMADLFLQVKVNGDLGAVPGRRTGCLVELDARRPRVHRRAHRRVRGARGRTCAASTCDELLAAAGVGARRGRAGRRADACVVRAHHRLLGDGPDPAQATRSRRSARSSTSCCCAATSAAPAPARARCAGTATCRATGRWASTRSLHGVPGRDRAGVRLRAAARARRTTSSRRSGRCATARSTSSWRWAATSSAATPDTAVSEAGLPQRRPDRPRVDEAEPLARRHRAGSP